MLAFFKKPTWMGVGKTAAAESREVCLFGMETQTFFSPERKGGKSHDGEKLGGWSGEKHENRVVVVVVTVNMM